jgi:hypothetical protein
VAGPKFTNGAGNPTQSLWVGSIGSTSDQGGLGAFSINLSPAAPPNTQITTYTGMKAVTLSLGRGDNVVTLDDPPPAPVQKTTVNPGDGADQIVINNYGANTKLNLGAGIDNVDVRVTAPKTTNDVLNIIGGSGIDTIDIESTGDNSHTNFTGTTGQYFVTIESVGKASDTEISLGPQDDTVRVLLAGLPKDATINLDGLDPSIKTATDPGDTLILDPQDPAAHINFTGDFETGGTANLSGFATVNYKHFETDEVIAGPNVTFDQPKYAVVEGSSLTVTVTIHANGTNNTLQEPVLFDIEGNGNWGDASATATATGTPGLYKVTLTLSWAQLLDFGLNDVGSYRIAVRATNGDGFSASATADVSVLYKAPVVTIADGAHTVDIGTPFTIDFSAVWPTPKERAINWIIDWGDGTTQILGSTALTATHIYLTTGAAAITATVTDKDNSKGTTSNVYKLDVTVPAPDAGGPYEISEGDSLTVTGSAVGTPTDTFWVINGKTYDKTTSVKLDWNDLVALGINDDGLYDMSFSASYKDFVTGANDTVTTKVKLTVDDTAPTILSVTNTGPVNQGQDVKVSIDATDISPVDAGTLRFRVLIDGGTYDSGFQPASAASLLDSQLIDWIVPGANLLQDGQQVIHVQVEDLDGVVSDGYTTVTVIKIPPDVSESVAPTKINEGDSVTLTVNTTTHGNEVIKTWDVQWGDGTSSHYSSNGSPFTHTYLDNGDYKVTSDVIDNSGTTYDSKDVVSVHADNVNPTLSDVKVTTPIDENSFADLSGKISDPGILDNFVMTVNWGDGSSNIYQLPAATENFDVAHQYANPGKYTITTSAVDKDGGQSNVVTSQLEVDNVAPVLGPIAVNPHQTDENGHTVTVSGTYTDVGPNDTHTVTIDWGDGTVMSSTDKNTTIKINTLNRSFTATHVYLDNPPVGTPGSAYTISAFVTDVTEKNAPLVSNTSTAKVEVDNVAPIFAEFTLNGVPYTPPVNGQVTSSLTIFEKGVVTIVGTIRDPGILDTEKLTINWNDPGVATQTVQLTRDALDPEVWHFTVAHQYIRDNPGGIYMPLRTITLTATDKDGGTHTVQAKITIAHIEPIIDGVSVNPPILVAGGEVELIGHITDSGLHPVASIVIDWGDGSAPVSLGTPDPNTRVTYDAATHIFTAIHTYLRTGVSGLHADKIHISVFDDDTGFAFATTSVLIEALPLFGFPEFFTSFVSENELGGPVNLAEPGDNFHSTVFNSIDVLDGGMRVGRLVADEGGAQIQLPLNLAELGGDDISKVEIDWGDGNKETLANPGTGTFDVAHGYPHVVGDAEIATGALNGNEPEVTVRAYKKDADGHDVLSSIKRYKLQFTNATPRIDRFSLHRDGGVDGDVDTIGGRIVYPNLPGSLSISITWPDGTTSDGAIELKNGEYWFSANRHYAGSAPAGMVVMRIVNTSNSKVIGLFELNPPHAATNAPASPPAQPPANPRHGDASPMLRPNRALALGGEGSSSVTTSDLALAFGAGVLASTSGLKKKSEQAEDEQSDDGARLAFAPPAMWIDRALATSMQKQRTSVDVGWLKTPFRVDAKPARSKPVIVRELDEHGDGWLVASETARNDAGDWLELRE